MISNFILKTPSKKIVNHISFKMTFTFAFLTIFSHHQKTTTAELFLELLHWSIKSVFVADIRGEILAKQLVTVVIVQDKGKVPSPFLPRQVGAVFDILGRRDRPVAKRLTAAFWTNGVVSTGPAAAAVTWCEGGDDDDARDGCPWCLRTSFGFSFIGFYAVFSQTNFY